MEGSDELAFLFVAEMKNLCFGPGRKDLLLQSGAGGIFAVEQAVDSASVLSFRKDEAVSAGEIEIESGTPVETECDILFFRPEALLKNAEELPHSLMIEMRKIGNGDNPEIGGVLPFCLRREHGHVMSAPMRRFRDSEQTVPHPVFRNHPENHHSDPHNSYSRGIRL